MSLPSRFITFQKVPHHLWVSLAFTMGLLVRPGPALAAQDGATSTTIPPAASSSPDFLREIRPDLEARLQRHGGTVGLAIVDPETGDYYTIRGSEPFPSASVIKVPLMVEVFSRVHEGQLTLEDPLSLIGIDRTGGSGILQYLSTPKQLTVWDAVFLMITMSDNVATNLVLEKVSPRSVTDRMESLGYTQTRLFGRVNERPSASFSPDSAEAYGFGVTTPNEMTNLYLKLYRKELVTPSASETMLAILSEPIFRIGLPRRLPARVKVAHKTGAAETALNDCGIVFGEQKPFVMCVMTRGNSNPSWESANEAEPLIADLALLVYRHLNP